MARFLGNASGRTLGADAGAAGFTKAKIFSTPGTTTFTVPQDVQKVKVFVVGAGSCYRTGTYDFCSSCCCSGAEYPRGCYCACFVGHLTGAGGGYSEKTFIQSTDFVAGKTLTINVGSIGGLSASSVSGTGLPTVTASNATEASYSWSCTSNSTARDNSNDNPITFGFCVPRCGYRNVISTYYNRGGTSSGGDVNRCGGRGVIIPQFIKDSYLDAASSYSPGGGGTENKSSCWINPVVNCSCMQGYHYTFGSFCCASAWQCGGCTCYHLCALISNLCVCVPFTGTDLSSRYVFAGLCDTKRTGSSISAETSVNGPGGNAAAASVSFQEVPRGIGAESGSSVDNGKNGISEQMALYVDLERESAATAARTYPNCCYLVQHQHYSQGYDYSFGGTQFSCFCSNYYPGCYSADTSLKGSVVNAWCYRCIGTTWTYVFGYNFSGAAHCFCAPYGTSDCLSSGGTVDRKLKCIQIGYINNTCSQDREPGYVIPLSTLVSDTNSNITDIRYGNGATANSPAGYGGGGNTTNPAGGSGIVVVVY